MTLGPILLAIGVLAVLVVVLVVIGIQRLTKHKDE